MTSATDATIPNPTMLNYLGALRGIKPRLLGGAFTFADLTCASAEQLTCLAASNPEGKFIGLLATDFARVSAEKAATERGVANVSFKTAALKSLAANGQLSGLGLPALDYIYADLAAHKDAAEERQTVYALADSSLAPGGILNLRYDAYQDKHGALKFLVREFGPEMNADQAIVFMDELKQLGSAWLEQNKDIAAKLDAAITAKMPDDFFAMWDDGEAASASFDTLIALRPRGYDYLGDTDLTKNYIELSLSPAAQQVIEKAVGNPIYEPVKDYALARTQRSDVWRKPSPLDTKASMPELFGGFSYGIPTARETIPVSLTFPGAVIPLDTPLYKGLLDLLTLVPASIGDMLAHPVGKGCAPSEIVGAIQILIACGLAMPMRSGLLSGNFDNIDKPRLVGTFNRTISAANGPTWLASPVLGGCIAVSAREAMVLKTLDRVGLAESASALFPELEKLAADPAAASRIMDTAAPTPEMVHQMIEDTVSKSIVQWYAYGVLAAA